MELGVVDLYSQEKFRNMVTVSEHESPPLDDHIDRCSGLLILTTQIQIAAMRQCQRWSTDERGVEVMSDS